jgi:hypothetical protein
MKKCPVLAVARIVTYPTLVPKNSDIQHLNLHRLGVRFWHSACVEARSILQPVKANHSKGWDAKLLAYGPPGEGGYGSRAARRTQASS